jgi:hypothetical protein
MLFGHKRNPHDNNKERYRGYEIKWRDNDGFSTLRDIKVKLFPDRRVLIRRIINEISATTGIPEDELLIRHS